MPQETYTQSNDSDSASENVLGKVPPSSESFGNVPNAAEGFRNVPKDSESFGTLPHGSERFRSVPKHQERKENHTLTVREAARLFEEHGVARTERSIVNWCQPNRMGMARLDVYYDPNERKYYLTPESVDRAIQEEKSKAARLNEAAAREEPIPKSSEGWSEKSQASGDAERVRELERQVVDLKIANRAKDGIMEQLRDERRSFFDKLLEASRKVGQLETKLLQLGPAKSQADLV